ncbi:AAA family ATPase [Delftia acidovorans]|uniref:AAA family ATPase n=1 Tax=Delftia acidovorans TaxID=80866 RepID=A0AAJ2R5S9_DELAC|nr:AAA family ATPase [Delftia acidovorans]MDX4958101.1 AAA family ATPase [Delftia acidovorans]
MRLIEARIQNFRSIEDQTVQFDEGCIVLVGINESGKSNVLQALNTLDPNVAVDKRDLRIERSHEDHVDHGVVQFHFELTHKEILRIYQKIKTLYHRSDADQPLLQCEGTAIGLSGLCQMFERVNWQVTIENNRRQIIFWPTLAKWSIVPGWYINGEEHSLVDLGKGHETIRASNIVFNPISFAAGSLRKLTIADIQNLAAAPLSAVVNQNLPHCIFWRYGEHNLLPSSIDRTEFISNPDRCVPLKSMFELAGIRGQEAISVALTEAQRQTPHRYRKLLQRVAEAATTHISKIWKDYKNVSIELHPNGEMLEPMISDNGMPIDMASRSEGFKRFVSFLLTVSAKIKTTELNNILLLVDEPENALHPSGAKSLSQELIAIGADNVVVYSTHSIFMIDKKNIARHRIVKRDNGVTVLHKAEKSRIQDEEVIYAAIGYSIFDSLKQHNVVFEGWRDKEIFRVIRDHLVKTGSELAESIAGWGTVHAEGVKDVKNVTKFLELAERNCLIVSDGDRPAVEKRTDFQKDKGWGTWVTLPDIFGKEHIQTGEDLLSVAALVRRGNEFAKMLPELRPLVPEDFPDERPCWPQLQKWIADLNLKKPAQDEKLNQLKSALYQDLAIDDLRDEAATLAHYIANSIG